VRAIKMAPDTRADQALALQARDGWPIPNSIEASPGANVVALARQAYPLVIAQAIELGPPTGHYNCHGLVFASRRVNIPPVDIPVDIDRLLRRDGYRRIDTVPQVGDIAVYRTPNGEIEHTGFVSRIEHVSPLASDLSEPLVWVWSMWGGLGEYEHKAMVSPYHDSHVEYWRLKP
jgi:hypothetical protein